MMYKKTMLFCDRKTTGKIFQTDDAVEIKTLGRMV